MVPVHLVLNHFGGGSVELDEGRHLRIHRCEWREYVFWQMGIGSHQI